MRKIFIAAKYLAYYSHLSLLLHLLHLHFHSFTYSHTGSRTSVEQLNIIGPWVHYSGSLLLVICYSIKPSGFGVVSSLLMHGLRYTVCNMRCIGIWSYPMYHPLIDYYHTLSDYSTILYFHFRFWFHWEGGGVRVF